MNRDTKSPPVRPGPPNDASLGEFAPGVDRAPTLDRRELGKLLGASLMLAGASSCTRAPKGRVLAYGRQPEQTPGVASTYATTMTLDGYATGLLVTERDGRPTKIEGNPEHPASLGAAGTFEQASILSLYDPDRLRGVTDRTLPSAFQSFVRAMGVGPGRSLSAVHFLAEPTSSPHVQALLSTLESQGATVHFHAPIDRGNVWRGYTTVTGQPAEPLYSFGDADVVAVFDGDPFASGPFHLRHARHHAARRRTAAKSGSSDTMSRLYVAEPSLTVTGSVADHRLALRRSEIGAAVAGLLDCVLSQVPPLPEGRKPKAARATPLSPERQRWLMSVARDLVRHDGRALVVIGPAQPPAVHQLAHLVNLAIGAVGKTIRYVPSAIAGAGTRSFDLEPLLSDIDRGRVQTLVILGGNPSYSAPAELDFSRRVRAVEHRAYLTLYDNETARDAQWVVPAAHYLESWGDARALDGTISLSQPMIEPLYGGKTLSEIISVFLGEPATTARESLSRYWRGQFERFDEKWPAALQRGVVADTAYAELSLSEVTSPESLSFADVGNSTALEVAFHPDSHAWDGSFANNAWLLELPDPITKLTWGNAAYVSARTAGELGVSDGDIVELAIADRSVSAPILVVPGQVDRCVSLSLGLGRQGQEHLANDVGYRAYSLRGSQSLWMSKGLLLTKTGRRASLAITQEHAQMEGRPLARTLLKTAPEPIAETSPATLYQLKSRGAQQWAMMIDLNACTGCSACVVACQAENNIPIVGKEGVEKGRAMHWLRIDRYFEGDTSDPVTHHQPMACQHCEKAPCEYVCPVGATVHSDDGLNEMVYNRCVGTRFCSNNCPYKVRRFNWFDYNRDKPETLKMVMNPDVTVRARGVMEKCTYCVQRIRSVEIHSHTAGVPIQDGDVRTACEQACPTSAITFGSIADPASRVSELRRDPRAYAVLEELGIQPRTRYLSRLVNPESGSNPMTAGVGGFDMASPAPRELDPPVMLGAPDDRALTQILTAHLWKPGRAFPFLLAITGAGSLGLFAAIAYTMTTGIGVWGNNIPVAWALGIVDFVWWIGIGHAGTFISAILYLLEQKWRTSINRFAEGMTLFAVVQAGLFPLLHLGRPWFFYWLIPYPSTMGVWPQWRSALPWDVVAVSTYLTVSVLFFYLGLIPDLAVARDTAPERWRRRIYGVFALGWRGSFRAWTHYRVAYGLLAGLATPLVLSVHSIVSMDFAISQLPGWHSTIFPPFFVAGAIYSGFAMVLTLLIPARRLFHLEAVVTPKHFDAIAKMLLVTGWIVTYSYAIEIFIGWYSGDPYERYVHLVNRPTGPYAVIFWTMLACNCLTPQLFWIKRFRVHEGVLLVAAVLINVGMWAERFVLIVTSESRDFLPSSWRTYRPSLIDLSLFLGTLSFFSFLFLLFLRFVPFVPVSELKEMKRELSKRELAKTGDRA